MARILIVAPSWVGDTVLAQPLFMRLKSRAPGVVLDVLAPLATASLLDRMPEVEEVIENPFQHGELKVFARRRLGLALKARRYERAIVLPNSLKSALPPYFASIPVRTGYRGEMRGGLLNDVRKLDEKHLPLLVERVAALAEKAGAPLQRPVPRPRLVVDQRKRRRVLERFELATDRPVVAFCPGAEYGPAKRWPAKHFIELGRALVDRGYQVWLFGSGNDRAIAQEIADALPGAANLAGSTSLDEAIDLLSLASRVVTNDSGLMHIAAALDRPMAAIFGSSSPAFTPPLSRKARVISIQLSCSPCFERVCPLGHTNCLVQLEPSRILTALD